MTDLGLAVDDLVSEKGEEVVALAFGADLWIQTKEGSFFKLGRFCQYWLPGAVDPITLDAEDASRPKWLLQRGVGGRGWPHRRQGSSGTRVNRAGITQDGRVVLSLDSGITICTTHEGDPVWEVRRADLVLFAARPDSSWARYEPDDAASSDQTLSPLPVWTALTQAHHDELETICGRLSGARIEAIRYNDLDAEDGKPLYGSTWDHGDWHHVVMGVELTTSDGVFTLEWSQRFGSIGVELYAGAFERELAVWDVSSHEKWTTLLSEDIERAEVVWSTVHEGVSVRMRDQRAVSDPKSFQVPFGIRLDMANSSIWFVAAMPSNQKNPSFFLSHCDELIIAFDISVLDRFGVLPGRDV